MNTKPGSPVDDHPAVWFSPPVAAAFVAVAGLLLDWLFPVFVLTVLLNQPVRYALGAAVAAGGGVLAALARHGFRRAKTPVSPSQRTRAIVTDGIFGVMRNPFYVGLLAALAGLAIALAADWLMVLLVPLALLLHHGAVLPEERYLEQTFGDAWRAYAARVPRYGWPS